MARIEAPYMLWRLNEERADHELVCLSLGKVQLFRWLMVSGECSAESAWIGETMVGFVVFRFLSFIFQGEFSIEELRIEQLVVDESSRRQKIGSKLLGRMLEKADSVSVRVDEYDKIAQRFLGKCGFKCVTPRATTEDWLGGYDSIDRSPIRFQWPGPPRYRFSRQKAAVPCPVVPGPQAVVEMQR
jgi:GNAT superfamily N-acetyltransferase